MYIQSTWTVSGHPLDNMHWTSIGYQHMDIHQISFTRPGYPRLDMYQKWTSFGYPVLSGM